MQEVPEFRIRSESHKPYLHKTVLVRRWTSVGQLSIFPIVSWYCLHSIMAVKTSSISDNCAVSEQWNLV